MSTEHTVRKSLIESGFGLVELMVALVIGLVSTLVIQQVLTAFEGQKRTSTSGTDAQINGSVALYSVEQAIRQAGYGLYGADGKLLCPSGINIFYDGVVKSNGGMDFSVPVIIRQGLGARGSDVIQTLFSDSDFGSIPTTIVKKMPTPSAEITASGGGGLKQSDTFVVAGKNGSKVCTLMQMSQDPQKTGNGWNLQHNSGQYLYNPANPSNVFTNAPEYSIGDVVVNMGSFAQQYFFIPNNAGCNRSLVVGGATALINYNSCDPVNNVPLVDQIVFMAAQYGISPAGSTQVNEWRSANNFNILADPKTTVPRVRAIRLAIVARSTQFEKEEVSPAAITLWEAGLPGDAPPVFNIDADGRHYRYKVYSTIVPIRNVIWGGV